MLVRNYSNAPWVVWKNALCWNKMAMVTTDGIEAFSGKSVDLTFKK